MKVTEDAGPEGPVSDFTPLSQCQALARLTG